MQLNKQLFSHPLIITALCTLITVTLCFIIYNKTKKAYWKVGFNDGTIQARIDIIEEVEEAFGNIDNCPFNNSTEYIELINVKAESLYLIKNKDGSVYFCNRK